MHIDLPEELSAEKVHNIVAEIQEKHPKVFAELVNIQKLAHFQKLAILDELLMEHPDLYCGFFKQ
jgi:predicted Zn-dependent protease with MMP-like domain